MRLILLPLIFFAATAAAQQRLSMKVYAGGGLVDLNGNKTFRSYYKPRTAFTGGAEISYPLNANLSLALSPAYEQLGAKSGEVMITDNFGNLYGNGVISLHYSYLTVPVLLSFRTATKVPLVLEGGPFAGFLLSAKHKVHMNGGATGPDSPIDYPYIKKLNFGVTLGAGARLPLSGNRFLTLGVRNNFGLSNIDDYMPAAGSKKSTNGLYLLAGVGWTL